MKRNYRLIGLDCANCAAKMERKIKALDGVNEAVVNFMTTKLILDIKDENSEETLKNVEKAIKDVDKAVEMKRA